MKTVLVVDDSLIMRKKLVAYIERLGHNVIGTANDGDEAIYLTEKLKPDIITMDVTMPGMDGITAVREIKKVNSDVKIIMITSHGKEGVVLSSIAAGAIAYLLKPIEEDKVEKAFHDLA